MERNQTGVITQFTEPDMRMHVCMHARTHARTRMHARIGLNEDDGYLFWATIVPHERRVEAEITLLANVVTKHRAK